MISARQNHIEISGNIFNGNAISVADMLLIPSAYGVQPAAVRYSQRDESANDDARSDICLNRQNHLDVYD